VRYLPLDGVDRAEMLKAIGAGSVDDLFADVPASALNPPLDLPPHRSEIEVERELSRLARRNRTADDGPFFVGCGAYRHHVPASVDHIIQRSEFLTSYTPYQPEIAQGTLQYLFEFQTQVALLTGMEIANASMYDGSTACAEAVLMARRATKRRKVVLSGSLHPHYAEVVRTVCGGLGGDEDVSAHAPQPGSAGSLEESTDDRTACVVVQSPDVFGAAHDVTALAAAAHARGALLIFVFTEVVSLGALKAPGDMGADIVVGEGQSIGNALNFGGPYVGLFAARQSLLRQMPGRIVGETTDADGRRGFVLTLSTREQHIRRDKATSNICTNSGLCCLAFSAHLSLLGDAGLTRLAMTNHQRAIEVSDALCAVDGVELLTPAFFNEFSIRLPVSAAPAVEALAARGVLAGVPASRLWPGDTSLERVLIVAATEMTTSEDIAAYADALKEVI